MYRFLLLVTISTFSFTSQSLQERDQRVHFKAIQQFKLWSLVKDEQLSANQFSRLIPELDPFINVSNDEGETPLMVSLRRSNNPVEFLDILLKNGAGADYPSTDMDGYVTPPLIFLAQTPLKNLTDAQLLKALDLLLQANANPHGERTRLVYKGNGLVESQGLGENVLSLLFKTEDKKTRIAIVSKLYQAGFTDFEEVRSDDWDSTKTIQYWKELVDTGLGNTLHQIT